MPGIRVPALVPGRRVVRCLLLILYGLGVAGAQDAVLPHSNRYWLSGQWNVIGQGHGRFHSPYAGANSLPDRREFDVSSVETLYTGVRLASSTELLFDVESAGGKGIGQALGLAGFTNLDVVRNPELGPAPYVARLLLHQTIALGDAREDQDPGFLGFARRRPTRRLELYAGRFSLVDFLDLNVAGSDSHLQFANWTMDNNGAYDYAADTRGYTYGVEAEYDDPSWSIRFVEALMPKVANGIAFDLQIAKARAENLEVGWRYARRRPGMLRLLTYRNHGRMGSYAEALAAVAAGRAMVPDITAHRHPGSIKYGYGLNWEQQGLGPVRLFARTGWNEGAHESFAYTEVDNTLQVGGDVAGSGWRRGRDRLGVGMVSNGISHLHRAYLAAGGQGFLLGDGHLNYGRENILESYYTAHVYRGLSLAADVQWIGRPGYNRDRGPVVVPAARLHLDF